MTRVSFIQFCSLVLMIAAQVGCSPYGGPGFDVSDLTGNYDITVDANAVVSARYSAGADTSALVPSSEIGLESVAENFAIAFSGDTQTFEISSGPLGSPTVTYLPASKARAVKSDGSEVAFDSRTGGYKSVTLELQLGKSTPDLVANGCERNGAVRLKVVFTKNRIDVTLSVNYAFQSVVYSGLEDYTSCPALLSFIGDQIRQGKPEFLGLTSYVNNEALDLARIGSVESMSIQLSFGGSRVSSGVQADAPVDGVTLSSGELVNLQFTF